MAHCPICKKTAVSDFRPFCSNRCKEVDLGKWLTGAYAVPSIDREPPTEEELEIARND